MGGGRLKGRKVASGTVGGELAAVARSAPRGPQPWLEGVDLRVLAKLPLSAALAWGVPERYWAALASASARLEGGARRRLAGQIETVLAAAALAEPADRIAARHLAMLRLDQLGYLRSYAPGGWRCRSDPGRARASARRPGGRARRHPVGGADRLRAADRQAGAARGGLSPAPSEPSGPRFLQPVAGRATAQPAADQGRGPLSRRARDAGPGQRGAGCAAPDRCLAARQRRGVDHRGPATAAGSPTPRCSAAACRSPAARRISPCGWVPPCCRPPSGAPRPAALSPGSGRRCPRATVRAWTSVVSGLAGILEAFAVAHPEQIHWGHNCIVAAPPANPA